MLFWSALEQHEVWTSVYYEIQSQIGRRLYLHFSYSLLLFVSYCPSGRQQLRVILYLSSPSGIRIPGNIRGQYVHQFWRLFTHGVTSSTQLTPRSAWLDWHLSVIFAPELMVIFACLQEYIDMRMYEDHLYINFDKTSGTMPSKSGSTNPRDSAMWH